jgi:hypothetical protein
MSIGHFRSGCASSSASARPTVNSEGTTSRNKSPEAAVASQIATMVTRMMTRSRVTGSGQRPVAGAACVRCPA